MPVTVTPLGVVCNLQCGYCYEQPQRDAGNLGSRYDLSKIKDSVDREGGPFLLFGGEPLLLPKPVLEELWSWGYSKYGKNSLQTNGTLIDSDHVALFKRYKVGVGISLDGPGELNDARWQGTLEKTRASTAKTEAAIAFLCAEGIPPNLIVTLHRRNATGAALEKLTAWFAHAEELGVRSVGLHLLEVEDESVRREFAPTVEENVTAVLRFRRLQKELPELKFTLIRDLEALLLGHDAGAKCIWTACDPYSTRAVKGIGGHGERTKCSRVNKDGVDFLASQEGFERYIALYRTPQEANGCQGCRFFLMCRGQCPGTAVDGDWRNRSDQCATWMRVFEVLEAELVAEGLEPLSLSPLRHRVEELLIEWWDEGRNATVESIVRYLNRSSPVVPAIAAGTAE